MEIKSQQPLQNIQLMVSYSGKRGHQLPPKMETQLKVTLPEDIKTMIIYKSTKLSNKFPVKDET